MLKAPKSKPANTRRVLLIMGTLVFVIGSIIMIERVMFFNRSVVMQARVLRQTRSNVEVLPRDVYRTLSIERARISRRTRLSYDVGEIVEVRADTTRIPAEAYMNSFHSLWFLPVGSIVAGLVLLLVGLATPPPWRL